MSSLREDLERLHGYLRPQITERDARIAELEQQIHDQAERHIEYIAAVKENNAEQRATIQRLKARVEEESKAYCDQRDVVDHLTAERDEFRNSRDHHASTIFIQEAQIARLQSEIAGNHIYASRLAVWLQRHHFANVVGFEAASTLVDVLSQIDNMVANLARPDTKGEP